MDIYHRFRTPKWKFLLGILSLFPICFLIFIVTRDPEFQMKFSKSGYDFLIGLVVLLNQLIVTTLFVFDSFKSGYVQNHRVKYWLILFFIMNPLATACYYIENILMKSSSVILD